MDFLLWGCDDSVLLRPAPVSEHLKFFVRKKMKEDVMWRRLTVVFSGHEVCAGVRFGRVGCSLGT